MSAKKRTESDMLRMLRRRYSQDAGNGAAYAFVPGVRNDAGFNANRTIDAMAMSLWPSRGLLLYAFEIKCSRTDWLKELKDPGKAEAFQPFVDYFYVVVSDEAIVKPGELPNTWGLMAPKSGGLGTIVEAPRNQDVQSISRGMLAALLRQAGVEAARPADEIEEARLSGFKEGRELGEAISKSLLESTQQRVRELQENERELVKKTGATMHSLLHGREASFYSAVKTALDGERDIEHLRQRISRIGEDAKVLAQQAERIIGEHFPAPVK